MAKRPPSSGTSGRRSGRQHRGHLEDHPLRLVAALAEGLDDAQALQGFLLALRAGLHLHDRAQLGRQLVQVEPRQKVANGLRAHLGLELVLGVGSEFPVRVLGEDLPLLQAGVTGIDDHVGLVVEHALQLAHRHVEQMPDAAGHALEEPDVAHRHRQLHMAHPLAAHLGLGHFDAATVAYHAPVSDALVLAARAFPVLHRTEDTLAEKAVLFRLERTVVDRLRLGDLSRRPSADDRGGGELDADGFEVEPATTLAGFCPRKLSALAGSEHRLAEWRFLHGLSHLFPEKPIP